MTALAPLPLDITEDALERRRGALEAAAHDLQPSDRPLVELAPALAKQMDEAEEPGPCTGLAPSI
jgi:hypothetical protein